MLITFITDRAKLAQRGGDGAEPWTCEARKGEARRGAAAQGEGRGRRGEGRAGPPAVLGSW